MSGDDCSRAVRHGPADRAGRCAWCGAKYAEAVSPDPVEVERRYVMGLYS